MKRFRVAGMWIATVFAALLFGARPAAADLFIVRNLDDSGPDSLRQAILNANAMADADIIRFQVGLTGTIYLNSPLTISNPVTIQGRGTDVHAVSGNDTVRVFNITGGEVTLSGLTVKEGKANDGGGVAITGGTVYITDAHITDNTATGVSGDDFTGDGGGVYCKGGTLHITNSRINGNTTKYQGGGVYCDDSTVYITDSEFSDNNARTGGGVSCESSTVDILNSDFSDNNALGGGGATFFFTAPRITNSRILNNTAFHGGGAAFLDVSSSTSTLTNVVISGNTATNGEGGGLDLVNGDVFDLNNVVISGNTATGTGGGIHREIGTLRLFNCTVAGNTSDTGGGGLWHRIYTTQITNSIVWGNSAPDGPQIGTLSTTPTVSYSDVQGGWPGTGNLNVDPQFVRNPFTINATDYGNLRLRDSSPLRSKGDVPSIFRDAADLDTDTDTTEPTPFDFDGNPRVTGAAVEMGAYELQSADVITGDVTGQTLRLVPQFVPNAATRTYIYYVQVQSTAPVPIAGPVSLVLEGLPAGVTLTNASGKTTAGLAPYVTVSPAGGALAPGGSLLVVLRFTSPTPLTSTLPGTVKIIAGPGPR